MKRLLALLAIVLLSACDGPQATTGPLTEMSEAGRSDVNTRSRGGSGDAAPSTFIVTLRPGARPEWVAQDHGLQPSHVYASALNGFAGSISEAARSGLLKDSRVSRIEADAVVTTTGDPQPNPPWGLDRIDQRETSLDGMYQFLRTGAGVTAYIVDTGIWHTHSEFSGRASSGFDVYGEDGTDCSGHGTHVAGIVGGETYGVAKDVDLVSVRVLDCGGGGTVSGVVAGLDWILANASGPSVVNMSLSSEASATLDDAVQAVVDGGVAVVAAAGNEHSDACWRSPARVPDIMTVAASNRMDERASFSNYGSCVDWFAPGVEIPSAYKGADDATAIKSGTSMSSPHTAGVAALFLDADPSLSPLALRDLIWERTTKAAVTDSWAIGPDLLYSLETSDESGGTSPDEPLDAPANVAATSSTENIEIRVSWTNVDELTEDVEVWYRTGTNDWIMGQVVNAGLEAALFRVLDPATTYDFRLRGRRGPSDFRRYSDWSSTVTAITCDGNPKNKKCGGGGGGQGGGGDTNKGNKGGNGKGKGG